MLAIGKWNWIQPRLPTALEIPQANFKMQNACNTTCDAVYSRYFLLQQYKVAEISTHAVNVHKIPLSEQQAMALFRIIKRR